MSQARKRTKVDNESVSQFQQVSNLEEHRIKDMPLSEIYYVPDFISKEDSDEWYKALLALDTWYRPTLKIFGREVVQSRKIAAYSTDPNLTLKYSGQIVNMKYEYPKVLREIQDKVEERLGVKFNHVMLNLYEDGKVYIGNHRDNLENKVIASVSVGAPRTFIMTRDKKVTSKHPEGSSSSKITSEEAGQARVNNKRPFFDISESSLQVTEPVDRKSWILDSGSLVVMQGDTQRYWKHEIPKEPKVKEGRISLTFRQLVT
uniref:Fe2OG dioxygenase domain-containing protein n=1 Tax=Psilocybe cubensis TaxID=181762 RepID=A0A8H7XMU3_PSICU